MTHPEKDALLAQKDEQIAELMAQVEAAKKAQEQPKEKTIAPAKEKIFIPRGAHSKDDPNFVVGFNGKLYVLPRGKEVEVPAAVAAEIRRSWRAAERYDKTREEKLAEAQRVNDLLGSK